MQIDDTTTLSSCSRALARGLRLACANADPESSIAGLLSELAQGAGARRAAVFEQGRDGLYVCSYAWHATDLPSLSAAQRSLPSTPLVRRWLKEAEKGLPVIVDDLGPAAVQDQELLVFLDVTGIQRFVLYPLTARDSVRGLLILYDLPRGRAKVVAPVLELASSSLAMLVDRRDDIEAASPPDRLDRVTGLQGLGSFSDDLDLLIATAEEGLSTETWSVVYLDVVDFKSYNASHGFAAGNELLRRLGHAICDATASTRVCRYDADRFYVITTDDQVESLVRTVHDTAKNDPALGVEVRAGIYRITGAEKSAVHAMDRAKMAGDASHGDFEHYWRRFDPPMEQELTMRGYVISHIDRAIQRGWVKAYYQPVLGTLSGKVEGVEALARWDDPKYGLLSPASFIDTLERGRLIYKLDLEILRQACQAYDDRRRRGLPNVPISVNISRSDLEVEGIHERIDAILESHAVPHSDIHIEITETALAQSEDLVRDHIELFRSQGFEVWLDDFGSGYSSLNALQRFDFDCAKIDMAFLHKPGDPARLPQFMADVVSLAKHRGLRTLVEGVETPEHYALVKEIGCMMAQGYLISRPLPQDELEQVLDKKDLGFATAAERLVYGQLGMTDVAGRREPLALVINQNDTLRIAYANAPCRRLLSEFGIPDTMAVEAHINADTATAALFRSCMRRVAVPGQTSQADLSQSGFAGRVRFRLVAAQGVLRAFLATVIETEEADDDGRGKGLRALCSLFDEVLVLQPKEDRVRLLLDASHLTAADVEGRSLSDLVSWMAREVIHPNQAGRFRRMLDPTDLVDRVTQAPSGILEEFFDLAASGETYELRRLVLALTPSSKQKPELVMCIARDLAGWTRSSLEGGREAQGGTGSGRDPSGRALWNAVLSGDSFGIFWKDADRRFLGANRMFLNYYGLELDDILGKNDEEMGWHPDPEPFRQDELRVLRRGDAVRDAPGTCLVHGKPRDIAATKLPIYQDGKIVGLLGYFMDVTDVIARMDAVHRRTADSLRGEQLTDPVTDLANARGVRESCRALEEAPSSKGADFGYLSIQILGMRQFESDYGTAVHEDLHRAIAQRLRAVVGEEDVVGRIYDGRYIIVANPCDTSRLNLLEEAIPEALSQIREVDGIRCTVYCMIGSALFSACKDYGLMTATAESGMMAGLALDGEQTYTRSGVARALRDAAPAWDLVRLVDPTTMQATVLADDGNFRRLPGSCSELLGKSGRCENCVSLRALETGKPQRKVERMGDKCFYIVARPVTVDGRGLVIEGVAEMDEELCRALR